MRSLQIMLPSELHWRAGEKLEQSGVIGWVWAFLLCHDPKLTTGFEPRNVKVPDTSVFKISNDTNLYALSSLSLLGPSPSHFPESPCLLRISEFGQMI